jgi:hypothetical protein
LSRLWVVRLDGSVGAQPTILTTFLAFLKLFFSDAYRFIASDPEVRWVRITVVPQSICGSHAASSIKLQPYANITSEEGNEQ